MHLRLKLTRYLSAVQVRSNQAWETNQKRMWPKVKIPLQWILLLYLCSLTKECTSAIYGFMTETVNHASPAKHQEAAQKSKNRVTFNLNSDHRAEAAWPPTNERTIIDAPQNVPHKIMYEHAELRFEVIAAQFFECRQYLNSPNTSCTPPTFRSLAENYSLRSSDAGSMLSEKLIKNTLLLFLFSRLYVYKVVVIWGKVKVK